MCMRVYNLHCFEKKFSPHFYRPSSSHHVFVLRFFSIQSNNNNNKNRSYNNRNNRCTLHTQIYIDRFICVVVVFSSNLFMVCERDSERVYVFYQWIHSGPQNDDNSRVTNLWTYFELLCTTFYCYVCVCLWMSENVCVCHVSRMDCLARLCTGMYVQWFSCRFSQQRKKRQKNRNRNNNKKQFIEIAVDFQNEVFQIVYRIHTHTARRWIGFTAIFPR